MKYFCYVCRMWSDAPILGMGNKCTQCNIGWLMPCSFLTSDVVMKKFKNETNGPTVEYCATCTIRFECWTT